MERTRPSRIAAALAMGFALAVPAMLPADAMAQSKSHKKQSEHRQQTKNQWRNLGIAGGALGVFGLLTGNKTLAALGLGGGLYSASRYEADRKSQNKDSHRRYELFKRTSFDHNGHHYVRKTKIKNGKKYYYFHKTR